MSFETTLDRHNDHTVLIIPRIHKNRLEPVPGLYCENCSKLIKWLTPTLAKELIEQGVEQLPMLKNEQAVWDRRQRLKQMI